MMVRVRIDVMSTPLLLLLLLMCIGTTRAVPYSKFGRDCKDIGCSSNEVCVIATEPCNGNQPCGRYPTCQKTGAMTPRPSSHAQPTAWPTPPTPPPRSSSFDNRYRGHSGDRNTIGNGSIWDRLFAGDSGRRTRPSGSGGIGTRIRDTPTTPRSRTSYYPGGKDHYTSHTSKDEKGNRVWTFSG